MSGFTCRSVDGTELSGRHWPVERPLAVMTLVHGFGEHCGRYEHMAAHLNAQGIAVVALDLNGHGRTPGPRGVVNSFSDFQNSLDVLLEKSNALYPDAPHVLYGHSMGGCIVLAHGLRGTDSLPIIASAPFIAPTQPVPKLLRVVVNLLTKLLPKGAISQPIDGSKISNLGEEQTKYLEDPLNHGRLGFRLAKGLVETGEMIAKDASSWSRPLLLLHSKADQLTAYDATEKFAAAAQQVEIHAFETSQHEMHNDAPRAEVYRLMSEFILRQTEVPST